MKKLNLDIQRFASTNKTTNYELPQFIGTDKPTWLGDFNEAMSTIDSGMHENATDIKSMASDVATASATASQASQDVSALSSTVSTLSTNVSTATTTANNAQSTATSALNTANTANGKADTNASAISTINSDISDLDEKVNLNASYSTTETIVGKWTDDKDIYRAVVTGKTGSTTNSWTKIANLSIDTMVSKFGYWIEGNDRYPIERNYNNEAMATYFKPDGIYEMHNYSYANNRQFILIVEYTKPTE